MHAKGRTFAVLSFSSGFSQLHTNDQHNSTWHRQITFYSFVVPFFNLCFTDNEFQFNLFRCWMLFFGLHSLGAISLGCLLMIIFNSKLFLCLFCACESYFTSFFFKVLWEKKQRKFSFFFSSTAKMTVIHSRYFLLSESVRCTWDTTITLILFYGTSSRYFQFTLVAC